MSTRVRYRLAELKDARAIGVQGKEAFLESFSDEYTASEIEGYFAETYATDLQREEIAEHANHIFLAEDDQGLLGHLKLGPCSLPLISQRPAAEVKRFYVLRRGQGTEVARTLLRLGVDTAYDQGAKCVGLSCWTGNERALRFYMREGFAIVGRQPFRVGSRVDEDYVMKRLS